MSDLGIDFDSVLADLAILQVIAYNAKHGTSLTKNDVTTWDFWSQQEHPEYVWGPEVFRNYDWTQALPPVPGAVMGMHALWEDGHTIYVVTDRPAVQAGWIWDWLNRHKIKVDAVVPTSRTGYSKKDAYRDLEITVGLDDGWHNVTELAPQVDTMYCFTQPWNKQEAITRNQRRVNTWDEFVQAVPRRF